MEFTKSYVGNTRIFLGVVEVGGIRLMGRIFPRGEALRTGMHVRMTKCGISPLGQIFYVFEPQSKSMNKR